jgi:hypothetical protein
MEYVGTKQPSSLTMMMMVLLMMVMMTGPMRKSYADAARLADKADAPVETPTSAGREIACPSIVQRSPEGELSWCSYNEHLCTFTQTSSLLTCTHL